MKKLAVLDLFAGAGGLSSGFEQTKQFKVTKAVELNKAARLTYAENHEDIEIEEDITKMEYTNHNGELKEDYKKIDVVIGGPPCQGFSNANRQKNTLISNNNQLIKEYIRAIEEIQPKAFIMENVKNMNSSTHKFYLTRHDKLEVLNALNINISKEKVRIGEVTSLFNDFNNFIQDLSKNKQVANLTLYTIKPELFIKLNTVYRLLKANNSGKVKSFFENGKNLKFILKTLGSWEIQHDEYWHVGYEKEWYELKNNLNRIIKKSDFNYDNLYKSLKEVLEVQKLIKKFQEIFQSEVLFGDLYAEEGNIDLDLYTYNVFGFLVSKLKSLGYTLNEKSFIFNAADYGVPQVRKRLILIGIRSDKLKSKKVIVPAPLFKDNNDYYTIYDAIGDLEKETPSVNIEAFSKVRNNKSLMNSKLNSYLNNISENEIYNHVMTESTEIALSRFKVLKEGQNFHDLEESLKSSYSNHERTQNTISKRLTYNKPSDTVVNVRKSMWIHPIQDRALSIREAARLQSFQDSYKFLGSKDQQYQQIGNAVPPLLARHIAEGVLTSLGLPVKFPVKDLLQKDIKSMTVIG